MKTKSRKKKSRLNQRYHETKEPDLQTYSQEDVKRFWNNIGKIDGSCWDWNGHTTNNLGYAFFNLNKKIRYAHQFSWILFNGEIPKNRLVKHKCRSLSCTNPDHLRLNNSREMRSYRAWSKQADSKSD